MYLEIMSAVELSVIGTSPHRTYQTLLLVLKVVWSVSERRIVFFPAGLTIETG
ncbi:MAG: hypothetical protein ABIK94_00685 [candidate division WOR-3 bacterium]